MGAESDPQLRAAYVIVYSSTPPPDMIIRCGVLLSAGDRPLLHSTKDMSISFQRQTIIKQTLGSEIAGTYNSFPYYDGPWHIPSKIEAVLPSLVINSFLNIESL